MTQNPIGNFRRLTIKIGSALLVDAKSGQLRTAWLQSLADDISTLRSSDTEIIIVTSGAISLGRRILDLTAETLLLEQAQAAAAVGQIALGQAWSEALGRHDMKAGQILITPNITEERRRYINARTTIATLISLNAVPIINENDSVATSEIRYGDNDRLSARVAAMISADCLIILSDVDGLYSSPPSATADGEHIAHVKSITPEIEAMAGGAASHLARGGMMTKIEAGKIATQSGTAMIIAKGTDLHPLKALADGARHTMFRANQSPAAARKRWILGTLEVAGTIHIDDGAAKALSTGKSLLPIGVTKVRGDFSRGDAISILGPNGVEIARGLAGMDKDHADLAKGKKSQAIIGMFGTENRTELVHADNLVLISADSRD